MSNPELIGLLRDQRDDRPRIDRVVKDNQEEAHPELIGLLRIARSFSAQN